jgi:hypothetical protein
MFPINFFRKSKEQTREPFAVYIVTLGRAISKTIKFLVWINVTFQSTDVCMYVPNMYVPFHNTILDLRKSFAIKNLSFLSLWKAAVTWILTESKGWLWRQSRHIGCDDSRVTLAVTTVASNWRADRHFVTRCGNYPAFEILNYFFRIFFVRNRWNKTSHFKREETNDEG